LLKEIRDRFQVAGWLATYVQIRPSVSVQRAFADVAMRSGRNLRAGSKLVRSMKKLTDRGGGIEVMGQGVTVGAGPAGDDYSDLRNVLLTLGRAASEDSRGVALVLDELQALRSRTLGELMNLVFELRDEIPLAFIGGGLTYLPAKIAKATTSTERLRYETTDFLSPLDARRAVTEPATGEGVKWEPSALDRVVELAEGYPYFLQLYASETWEVAKRNGRFETVRRSEVDAAEPLVARQLKTGLYGARFDKLGPKQREYVLGMEALMHADPVRPRKIVRSGEVAQSLGSSLAELSTVRDSLIRSGTVHAPAHGDLEFSVPGFAEYVAERREEELPR
jgi:hypothetical protein